jgi:hypothetical protein
MLLDFSLGYMEYSDKKLPGLNLVLQLLRVVMYK